MIASLPSPSKLNGDPSSLSPEIPPNVGVRNPNANVSGSAPVVSVAVNTTLVVLPVTTRPALLASAAFWGPNEYSVSGDALVSMMQAADLRKRSDSAGRLHRP